MPLSKETNQFKFIVIPLQIQGFPNVLLDALLVKTSISIYLQINSLKLQID